MDRSSIVHEPKRSTFTLDIEQAFPSPICE